MGTAHPIFAARAENAQIWDAEGRRFVDFAGGIAVLNVGHRHPKVMAAVEKQLALTILVPLTASDALLDDGMDRLEQALVTARH